MTEQQKQSQTNDENQLDSKQSEQINNTDNTNSTTVDDNPDFDNFVNEQTKSHVENEQSSNINSEQSFAKNSDLIDKEEAAQMCVTTLMTTKSMIEQQLNVTLQLSQMQIFLFSTLVTPCIQKYGKTIKNVMSGMDLDMDSYQPEIAAIVGIGSIAVPSYISIKKQKSRENIKTATQANMSMSATEKEKESGGGIKNGD